MIYGRMYGLPRWRFKSPFEELDRMRRQMDQMVEDLSGARLGAIARSGVFPAVNLTEDKNNFYIRAELPGVQSEDLDIEATGNGVSIAGERRIPAEEEGARYHRREREAGRFSRIVNLPSEIDADQVAASLSNGILTVVVPKAEKAKPRQIAVK